MSKDRDLKAFLNKLAQVENLSFSTSLVDRICESGGMAGSPFFHWRWKKKYCADVVIWPKNKEHLREIVKAAQKYKIALTPRGGGSSYFGSSVPVYGGAVLDMKQMNVFEIDKEKMILRAESGTTFINITNKLKEKNLELGSYPTSALSATIGGWIGTGGTIGIGTFENGSLINQVNKIQVITPKGEINEIRERKKFQKYFGSCGIFGIISEIELKLYPREQKIPLIFGFKNFKKMITFIKTLHSLKQYSTYFLRFSDRNHELSCRIVKSKYKHYLFIVLSEKESKKNNEIQYKKNNLINLMEKHQGTYLGKEDSKESWEKVLKYEMIPKSQVAVLMLQTLFTSLNECISIIDEFEKKAKKMQLNHAFYGIINRDLSVRLVLFTPTDNNHMNHFLTSKAVLHKIVKEKYESTKEMRVYTYGLLNTLYLNKFEKEKQSELIGIKKELDPNEILNPGKLTSQEVRFRRINTIFTMNIFWRTLASRLGIAYVMNKGG